MNNIEELLQTSIKCDFKKIKDALNKIVVTEDYKELEDVKKMFEVFEDKVTRIFDTRDLMEQKRDV